MVDSGGFQAATKWEDCEYPYNARELFEWAADIGPDIVAGMDVACETRSQLLDLATCRIDPGPVDDRIAASLEYQIEQLQEYRDGGWASEFVGSTSSVNTGNVSSPSPIRASSKRDDEL
jgi:hypothetical protein